MSVLFNIAVRLTAILAAGSLVMILAAVRGKARWQQVSDAYHNGMPRTAIELLQPIIDAAIKLKKYPEAVKAVALKIVCEAEIEGGGSPEAGRRKVILMRDAIAKAPKEMAPLMDALLAHWYLEYFRGYRWELLDRSTTTGRVPDDPATWELSRFLDAADRQFSRALAAGRELKTVPVPSWADLLEPGSFPDRYRPTLYDFLANDALAFYAAPEQAGSAAEDAFEILASTPIFGPVDAFLRWQPQCTDSESRTLKAVRLFQELLRFHQDDKDRSAFLDADLGRLNFGYNRAFGEEKAARYKEALRKFVADHPAHELSAKARWHLGNVLQQEGELVAAHALAEEGAKAFPESAGGKLCFNLARQIESKSYQVRVEQVWNSPWPAIHVSYSNLTRLHFRVVAGDFAGHLRSHPNRPESMDTNRCRELLARKPVREWSVRLPATPDFSTREKDVTPPEDLRPGFYFLIASSDPAFGSDDNAVSATSFWVSDLALVLRNGHRDGRTDGFVLRAGSGEPVEGAQVEFWLADEKGRFAPGPTATTDRNGLFHTRAAAPHGCLVLAGHNGQQIASSTFRPPGPHHAEVPGTWTVFFTDRSLYRPGQMVRYKGICLTTDRQKDDYHTEPNQAITVVLEDGNGQEVARQDVRCNEWGSFDGIFTAPASGLRGEFSIRTAGPAPGSTTFHVEEYKRPKFEVSLEPPTAPARLNGAVRLPGKAVAYTGAAVGGARVHYRVTRLAGHALWRRRPQPGSQEIAHGVVTTAADGTFEVEFVARPDRAVPEEQAPTFVYAVHVDIADPTGETRSADRELNIGYTALQAAMTADEWQTPDQPVRVAVRTTTPDGDGRPAMVKVKAYRVRQPERVLRGRLEGAWDEPLDGSAAGPDPDSWSLDEEVGTAEVGTDGNGNGNASFRLGTGIYRVLLEGHDRFGKPFTARLPVQVLDPNADRLGLKVPNVVAAPKWSLEPGQEFLALWGTGYEKGRAFIEVEHRGQLKQAFWTDAAKTQVAVKQAVTEAMRGGFVLRITMVRENRAYLTQRVVEVPWKNKELTVKWEHFTSKLGPAKKETWTAVITGPDARRAVAEMVATLYDESLDAYRPHQWAGVEDCRAFRYESSSVGVAFENGRSTLAHVIGAFQTPFQEAPTTYRFFPPELVGWDWWDERNTQGLYGVGYKPFGYPGGFGVGGGFGGGFGGVSGGFGGQPAAAPSPLPRQNPTAIGAVTARKNLAETAFFFPHVVSDSKGVVRLQFTMPEAVTRWKFMAFAHDRGLRSGYLESHAITAKDLMVQPNAPRFLREGDAVEFTVKVSNQSDRPQAGTARLTFADARTGQGADRLLANNTTDRSFEIPPKESRTLAWRLEVPDGVGPLTYKAVAATDQLSDGEEGGLPVLSRRVLVTESLTLPVRGPAVKQFDFAKLRQSADSPTLQSQSLTVQMVSNPSWYAVMALPYLMEYPYECSEQTFNRLYANALARHIAASDPKIHRVFEQWRNTPALDSPLEKNQELKSVTLEETPWLRQAKAESQARRNVGILFDDNRLNAETANLVRKLAEMQTAGGAWPWFPGGKVDYYITLYITAGFGRLNHLGVKFDINPSANALEWLDDWIRRSFWAAQQGVDPDGNHLSTEIAFYLYARSFFLKDQPIADESVRAVDYFVKQARAYWPRLDCRCSRAHVAIALHRFGDKEVPAVIMKSIREQAIHNDELGWTWRDGRPGPHWTSAPIETQALMIEAFDEVLNDAEAVEACKTWLLKQKQTQEWKTTTATADACYALLLRGENPLRSDALVEMKLGDTDVRPEKVEAGTSFYEQRFVKNEVKPSMAAVTVRKQDKGVAWGSVSWQYLEDVGKLTPHEGTPLKVKKVLYTRKYTKKGPVLEPVTGPVRVGDELVVRVELRTDRDMEYVHLKDGRGSGTEPVNVLSRYRYQDGLGYYETTRDAASHFFIDYLPKGAYVFEYPLRVQLKGQYQTGMAEVQCMYAPEFNSHSESIPLHVR